MDEPTAHSWDPLDCQAHIVEIIGNKEQFPRDNLYYPGFMVVLLRLMERYGEDYFKSYSHVLRAFLEDFSIGTEAEKELWASWRSEHASRITRRGPCAALVYEKVAGWDDGKISARWSDPNRPSSISQRLKLAIIRHREAHKEVRMKANLELREELVLNVFDINNVSTNLYHIVPLPTYCTMAPDKESADLNKALPEPGISSDFGLSFTRGLPSDPGFRARYSGSTETSVDGIPAYIIRHAQNNLDNPEQPLLGFDSLGFDSFGSGDPVKFNPSSPRDEDTTMTAEDTYKEIANSNPYQSTRCTTIDELIKSYEATIKKSSTSVAQPPPKFQLHHKPKGMSKSFSENNMAHGKRKPVAPVPRVGKTIYEAEPWVHDLYEGTPFEPGQPRLLSRSPSPPNLDHMKEYQPMGVAEPVTPPKRSRSPIKQLFSGKGLLGRSTSMNELPDEDHRKKGMKHWSEKIKQRVGGMTDDVSKMIRDSPGKSPPYISKFPVSLDPPTQAKLYSDMELMICATANRFLMVQKCEGRISIESLTKVMQFWHSKNRPQVIEFMFDQATQRDLVLYNLKTVRFYGPSAEEPVKMSIMMQAWRTLAKEMSVRTFCTPDSVIRKHMFDLYKILEMLGAPMVTFMAFQEIQVRTLAAMREAQKKRDEYQAIKFGVERKWEPPLGFDSKVDSTGQAFENPFDKY